MYHMPDMMTPTFFQTLRARKTALDRARIRLNGSRRHKRLGVVWNLKPISFWKQNVSKYPLQNSASKVLLSPSQTSTPSEREFKIFNLIQNDQPSLSPENVGTLVFVNATWEKSGIASTHIQFLSNLHFYTLCQTRKLKQFRGWRRTWFGRLRNLRIINLPKAYYIIKCTVQILYTALK